MSRVPIRLGCIADDVTGAGDVASMLTREGISVEQLIGLPGATAAIDSEAVVIALKTRTAPVTEAITQARAAAAWLSARGAAQLYFKICSTFDSTDRGNIGPVAEALLDDADQTIGVVCPAHPINHRTVFRGHLFVGDLLLSESDMRNHPLTPMTDADLVRVLARQSRRQVGLVPLAMVEAGHRAIRRRLDQLSASGIGLAIVDSLSDQHLEEVARACSDHRVVTGAAALGASLGAAGRAAGAAPSRAFRKAEGPMVVLSGSCSEATRGQVERAARELPILHVDPLALADGRQRPDALADSALTEARGNAILVSSTAHPRAVSRVREDLGREAAGSVVEDAMAEIARRLVDRGVRTLVVAGGETSGAVSRALGVRHLRTGPEIAPGVAWAKSVGEPELLLAFKSGNFGGPRFFLEALEMIR